MENNFEIIATKVAPDVARRIEKIAAAKGMTKYQLNQMVLDTIVRYMDSAHNMTEEMERVMSVFEHMIGWADALNLADPTSKKEVTQAVYVMHDASGKKKGCRCSMVSQPFFDQWEQTENITTIFERMVEVLLPDMYRRLRELAVKMDCSSMVELLLTLADTADVEYMNAEFRKEFEDADRSDWGKKPADAPYKRKHNMSADLFDNPSDRPILGKDYRPFDVEY